MVYGDFKKKIADEDHPQNPKEIYGTMKLSGEIVTRGLCNFYSIPFSIIRPSSSLIFLRLNYLKNLPQACCLVFILGQQCVCF